MHENNFYFQKYTLVKVHLFVCLKLLRSIRRILTRLTLLPLIDLNCTNCNKKYII